MADLRAYEPPEAARVFAGDGSFLAHLSPHRRVVLPYERVPALLRDGFVAVEDRRFWDHGGVDLRAVARASLRNVMSLSFREGFSTITMQLARTVFPDRLPMSEKVGRKLCEVKLAPQVERSFTKQQILQLYLNQLNLGDGTFGVEAAAQGYFGKSAVDLSVAEAALLIGLAKNPAGYNPRRHPAAALARRNVVLEVMAREAVIEASVARAAQAEPVRLAPPLEAATPAPYFVAAVRRELHERLGEEAASRGYRVHTSLEPQLQRAAAAALRAQLGRIEAGAYGTYAHARPENGRLEPASRTASQYLQGLVVALDPGSGAIRALVGGRDFSHSQYDRALLARRQPGSAFKGIVYAAALRAGLTLAERVETTPVSITAGGGVAWRPRDHVADSVDALSVRDALAQSANNATVRIGRWVGERKVIELAQALGITSPIPEYPSILLGAAEVAPVELVAAYAAFGNGGWRITPHLITRVEDSAGRLIWAPRVERRRALDEDVAFLTLSALEEVVDRGTGNVIRQAGFWLPAAGKTGTSNQGKDAWFIGLTPDLAAGIWVGFDRPRAILPGGAGGAAGFAVPAWTEMMKAYYVGRPAPAPWSAPETIRALPVDATTGGLATGNCPDEDVRVEYFRQGSEPAAFCPLHPERGFERFFDRLWRRVRGG